MSRVFSEFNDQKWEQVRTHPYFADTVRAITERAERYLVTDPPRVKFSEIHLYAVTGNRTVFQAVYSNYQDRMETFFFMYLLTKDEKYITPLADSIWNLCDFESWSIPAHVAENLSIDRRRQNLDLCSTILGFRMAEVLYFAGDVLPELVYRRAKAEIRYRVLDSYKKYDASTFWWMRVTNNWSAVCIGATLAAFLYAGEPGEVDPLIPRMVETANCYLRGFAEDGCCAEGYGYWNYGFSHFCLFASLLREYTDGKINLFDDPKVHEIARFQQNITLNDTQCISFSDGGDSFHPAAWLSHFLKHEYPDLEIPSFRQSKESAAALRYILWQDPDLAEGHMAPRNHIYRDTQWFIWRGPYTVAAKAGSNDEPHNHNDIGSFIISKNGRTTFTDPGGAEYTRQYFSSERYQYVATSGRGHSIPIINGEYQVTGKKKSEIYTARENEYCFSMENGYNIPTLSALTRDIRCEEDAMTLTDTYVFSERPASVTERFVSLTKPEPVPGGVRVGDTVLTYDPAVFTLSFAEEPSRRSPSSTVTVYMTDLTVINPEKEMTLTFRFA